MCDAMRCDRRDTTLSEAEQTIWFNGSACMPGTDWDVRVRRAIPRDSKSAAWRCRAAVKILACSAWSVESGYSSVDRNTGFIFCSDKCR